MIVVKGLIWDDWNKKHIAKHGISPEEIEEVCHGNYKAVESFRKRILVVGRTKKGRLLVLILSPEDKNLRPYSNGIYYPITAFVKGVKQ